MIAWCGNRGVTRIVLSRGTNICHHPLPPSICSLPLKRKKKENCWAFAPFARPWPTLVTADTEINSYISYLSLFQNLFSFFKIVIWDYNFICIKTLEVNPTKMYIKSAPYLHQKWGNWTLNMMIWCWCCSLNLSQTPNSTFRRCNSSIIFKNYDANLHQI